MRKIRPSALLASDLHMTSVKPRNRLDDYYYAMESKLLYIKGVVERFNLPFVIAGDMFDKCYERPEALTLAIEAIINGFAITGNHDLPYHNHTLYRKSSMATVEAAGNIKNIDGIWKVSPQEDFVMFGIHYGYDMDNIPECPDMWKGLPKLAVLHEFVYMGEEPFPGCRSPKVDEILDRLPQFDCIHIGDNHIPFTYKRDHQLVINAGSMMRSTCVQANFEPRVYLWFAGDNTFKELYLPIADNVFAIESIEKEKDSKKRIDAFVEQLGDGSSIKDLDFIKNLKKWILCNEVEPEVKHYLDIVIGE